MRSRLAMKSVLFSLMLLTYGLGLRANDAPCVIISAGAETDGLTGSILNVGQAVIGRVTDPSVVMHAGGIPCLAIHVQCFLGDVNGDGQVNGLDVQPYIGVTLTGVGTPREMCAADITLAVFVNLLLNS